MQAELMTAENELVRQFTLPPFQIGPKVIVWGGRVFARDNPPEPSVDNNQSPPWRYWEVFAYWPADHGVRPE